MAVQETTNALDQMIQDAVDNEVEHNMSLTDQVLSASAQLATLHKQEVQNVPSKIKEKKSLVDKFVETII